MEIRRLRAADTGLLSNPQPKEKKTLKLKSAQMHPPILSTVGPCWFHSIAPLFSRLGIRSSQSFLRSPQPCFHTKLFSHFFNKIFSSVVFLFRITVSWRAPSHLPNTARFLMRIGDIICFRQTTRLDSRPHRKRALITGEIRCLCIA